MMGQELIDSLQSKVSAQLVVEANLVGELLHNYKRLIEDNATLHKELAKLRNSLDVIESS